jgi:hypothetical protein
MQMGLGRDLTNERTSLWTWASATGDTEFVGIDVNA